jgi:branched-subunit amino acid ABC-type transport system permease component
MEALFYSLVNRVTLDVTAAPSQQAQQFDLVMLGRIVFNGLTFGSIYALVALGIALIYKTSDVVNFGHGEMAMFATFICFTIFGLLLPPRRQGQQLPDSVDMLVFVVGLIGALIFAALMGGLSSACYCNRSRKPPCSVKSW